MFIISNAQRIGYKSRTRQLNINQITNLQQGMAFMPCCATFLIPKIMKIAVRVKSHKTPIDIIVDVPDEVVNNEDRCNDACHDEVEELIGERPKWIRLLGIVDITPLS